LAGDHAAGAPTPGQALRFLQTPCQAKKPMFSSGLAEGTGVGCRAKNTRRAGLPAIPAGAQGGARVC